MDGDVAFGVTEKISTTAELSTLSGILGSVVYEGQLTNAGSLHHAEGANPIPELLVQSITVGAAILGTFVAAWVGHLFLTPDQNVEQAIPDLVALLVFLLACRLR